MTLPDTAEAMHKAASAATYIGGGGAVASGGAPYIFGMTPNEWNVLGVIVGMAIGIVGYLTSLYFKAQHLKIARQKAQADPEA